MLDQKLLNHYQKLFMEKKYEKIIFEIEESTNINNRPPIISNILGVCKNLKSNKSLEDIISSLKNFKSAYNKDKSSKIALEALINYINSTSENIKNYEEISEYLKIAEEMFLEGKKNFKENEKFLISGSNLYKRLSKNNERKKILKNLIDNHCKEKNIWCSYGYINNFSYDWLQKDFLNFSKKLRSCLPKYKTKKISEINYKENSKIKIGFISADLYSNHSVTHFLYKVLMNLDKKKFSVNIFSLLDESLSDETTYKFKEISEKWHEIEKYKNQEIVNIIQEEKIEILIDLMGLTGGNRVELFNSRISPVQINWLGYNNTIGLKHSDYLISDNFSIYNGEEKYYSEKIIKLPKIWNCHSGFIKKRILNETPFKLNNHITFGSFNNFLKISNETIEAWSKILKNVKNSKLILKSSVNLDKGSLLQKFKKNGIENSIIIFNKTNFDEHLNMYNKIDLALDTFPYNGVTTTFESLWMSVPVLTIKGFNFNSRCGESILRNAKLEYLIADDIESYVEKAIFLSNNIDEIINLRNKIYNGILKTPLFSSKEFTKDFTDVLLKVYKKSN